MIEKVKTVVFRQPEGRYSGAFLLAFSLVLLSVELYQQTRYGYGITPPLILGISFGIFGVAELLPRDQRRLAGGTRITAVLIAISFIVLS